MSEHGTLDEAIVALRAMRGDTSNTHKTLERIGTSLGVASPRRRVVNSLYDYARSTDLRAVAVVAMGLLLATSSYAAFFGLPSSLTSWSSSASVAHTAPDTTDHVRGQASAPDVQTISESLDLIAVPVARSTDVVVPIARPVEAVPPNSVHVPLRIARSNASSLAPRSTAPTVKAEEQPDSPAPLDDPEKLYTDAHHLHFVIRDFAAALHAWEQYLRVAEHSPLAVDARYNRALCLVRLGDHSAARSALSAIARGEDGAYREREARALLKVLR